LIQPISRREVTLHSNLPAAKFQHYGKEQAAGEKKLSSFPFIFAVQQRIGLTAPHRTAPHRLPPRT
jgi:hypothetical protein